VRIYIIRRGLYKEISRIAPKIGGDILDFGCGQKPYETCFVNANTYIGLDILVSGHNHRSSKVDIFYDGKTLPFPDNSFDSVVSFEVLEHVFNLDEVLCEISRVLKPGGTFLMSVPFVWEEHEVPYDFARYTSYGLVYKLKKNDYKILELLKSTTSILAIGQLLVNYIANNLLPRGRILARFSQLLIIFPLNLLIIFINYILPKRYTLYCNCVVLCKNL
jgi:SAM-dependent methyltransferase